MAKPFRKKGFPLYNNIGELVDSTHVTGQGAFQAGQPGPVPPTPDATPSALTSYVPAIDPVLLDASLKEGRDSDEDLVIYSHQSTALGPLTTVQDCTTLSGTVNTPERSFFECEMDLLMSSISNILSDTYTCSDKSQDDK